MMIKTVWIVRPSSPTEPELVCAWDEFSVDANPEGWEADANRAMTAVGDDLLDSRVIDISVSDGDILGKFEAGAPVEGRVQP